MYNVQYTLYNDRWLQYSYIKLKVVQQFEMMIIDSQLTICEWLKTVTANKDTRIFEQ